MLSESDLAGQMFGRLEALFEAPERKHGRVAWRCKCSCGNLCDVTRKDLRGGRVKSCGCYGTERRRQSIASRNTSHGMTNTPTYKSWNAMMGRCYNPQNMDYPDYGAKGIAVCDEWHRFEAFHRDMSDRPKGTSLDRIENDKGYCPENCRWATPKQQARNRRNNRLLACNGQTLHLAEWVKVLGIPKSTIANRLRRGWTVEQALEFAPPPTKHGKRSAQSS